MLELERELASAREEIARLRELAASVNEIRNSIIGLQSFNWSEHVYPLVAALKKAGIDGMSYPGALANFGTMLERTNAAESDLTEQRRINAELVERVKKLEDMSSEIARGLLIEKSRRKAER
jgi:hypothetical protein